VSRLAALAAVALAACKAQPIEMPALDTPTEAMDATVEPAVATLVEPTPGVLRTEPSLAEATPGAEAVAGWRPPPYPAPWALRPEDHFYFSRPIPSGEVNWPHPRYRYGSTYFGAESTHTGVDLGAARSAPVLASADGEVVWTGYGLYRGIPDPNDPYGLAIAIRHDFGFDGQPLYTIYAHLESSLVWKGQPVRAGEQIGTVGDTGHASGPHLHFEVRLGENYFFSTRNPELWLVPPEGWGVLAGRILGTYGQAQYEKPVLVTSVETGQTWEVWTYAKDTVHPDPVYNENFVLGDLPAGPYEVRVVYAGRAMTAWLFVLPGQTNFITFRGQNGFEIEPTPTPSALAVR